jgi:uncharacterized coiled-coil protein SlyX
MTQKTAELSKAIETDTAQLREQIKNLENGIAKGQQEIAKMQDTLAYVKRLLGYAQQISKNGDETH